MRGAAVAVVLLALILPAAPAPAVEVVCHRGANEYAPENTRAAAQLCIDWGVEYVEIDVRTSRDGVMYVIHDRTVDRTTDGTGSVRSLSSEEIDRLDAGSWFGEKFKGEPVPRLEPYLQWIKGKAKVYFDVKDADIEELVALVRATGFEKECFFWFGNPLHAKKFREVAPDLPLKINVASVNDAEEAANGYNAQIAEIRLHDLTPELQANCRSLGLRVMIYHPAREIEAFEEVIRRGADMINLNHADVFIGVERRLTRSKR